MNIRELAEQGITRARLPFWNEFAYAEFPETGPWVKVYDVLHGVGEGEPISVLRAQCERDDWEPLGT